MRIAYSFVITGILAVPAAAATVDLTVTIPQLKVAEYHKPYVAIWLEQPGQPAARTLAIWYDHDMKAGEGTKWLRDVRTWWRKSGRTMTFPADGVTGATRAPGPKKASLDLGKLAPGQYELVIEAAREVGGRELVRLPFTAGRAQAVKAGGSTELGAITATIKP